MSNHNVSSQQLAKALALLQWCLGALVALILTFVGLLFVVDWPLPSFALAVVFGLVTLACLAGFYRESKSARRAGTLPSAAVFRAALWSIGHELAATRADCESQACSVFDGDDSRVAGPVYDTRTGTMDSGPDPL